MFATKRFYTAAVLLKNKVEASFSAVSRKGFHLAPILVLINARLYVCEAFNAVSIAKLGSVSH